MEKYTYTIENIVQEPHDLDEEIIYFNFEFHYTEPNTLVLEYFYSFRDLMKYLKDAQPEFHGYLTNVRKGLDVIGACDKILLSSVGDEAIDQLYNFLKIHLTEIDLGQEIFIHRKKSREKSEKEANESHTERAASILEDLKEAGSGLREYNQRHRDFCNKIQKSIRSIALEVYPEIEDLEPEQMKAFKHLFVDSILQMHSTLENFLNDDSE